MGKIHDLIQTIQLKYFTLSYGEKEARKLLLLKGKERAERLAMLDTYGKNAEEIMSSDAKRAAQTEALNVIGTQIEIAVGIKSGEEYVAVIEETLKSERTTDLMREYFIAEKSKTERILSDLRPRLKAATEAAEEVKKRLLEEEKARIAGQPDPPPAGEEAH